MTFIAFLLAFGAALRLTHLVVIDKITAPFRGYIEYRFVDSYNLPENTPLRELRISAWHLFNDLINCVWCAGLWISFGVMAVAGPYGDSKPFVYAAGALSISWLLAFAETIHDVVQSYEKQA